MKKIFMMIVFFLIIFIFTLQNVNALEFTQEGLYKNYYGVLMTYEQVNNLKNIGFTENEIYLMESDEFDSNKNLIGSILANTTKYYKIVTLYENDSNDLLSVSSKMPISYSEEISEEQYNNSENTVRPYGLSNGYTETEYKKMTTTIIRVNGRYRYKNTLVWKKIPKVRSYDIMAIGIDSIVSGISSTKYFKRTADILGANTCYYDSNTTGTWELSGTGYGVTFKLPSNNINYTVQGLEMYMYFDVQKLLSTTIKTLNAYGDYKHAIITVNSSVSSGFSVGTSGINFDVGVSNTLEESYDSINTAQATWSNLGW